VAKKKSKMSNSQPAARKPAIPAAADTFMGPMTLAEKIAWWCLNAMIFIVPLAISNPGWIPGVADGTLPWTYDQFDIIKVCFQRGFTLIALGAWGWHILMNGGRIRRTKVEWLIGVFLGWVLITSFTSIHPPTAIFGKYRRFEGLISFVNYAAIFFITVQLADRASRIRVLARTLFWSGTIVSLYGVGQYLGIDPINWGNLPFEANRAFATYGNPDLLGGFLVFPLAISLALALSESKRGMRFVYWGGFLVTVVCWIVAFTRGAWIGGAFAMLLVIGLAWHHSVKLNEVDYTFMGLIGAAAALVVYKSLSATNAVMNVGKRLSSITDFDGGSAKTRFEIWEAAINAIKDRPIFGFGADTFRLVFPAFKPERYVADAGYLSVADNVHNYPLQVGSALGVPGFLLLYGIFGTVAWKSGRMLFRKYEGSERLVLVGFWAACAGYLAHLMFGLSVTGSTFLLWVSMAVVLSPLAVSTRVKAPSWGSVVAILLIFVVAAGSVLNVNYFVADHYYLQSRISDGDGIRIEHIEKAISLNPYNDMYRAELGMAHQEAFISLITQALQMQKAGEDATLVIDQARASFLRAEAAMLDTIEFVEPEYDNYVFLTAMYNLGAEYLDPSYLDKAIDIGLRGVEVEQYGPAVRFHLARAYFIGQDYEQAEIHLIRAAEMDPRWADPRLLLTEVYMATGRDEEAIPLLEEVLARNPARTDAQTLLDQILGNTESESE
jgi:O-antigen ligase